MSSGSDQMPDILTATTQAPTGQPAGWAELTGHHRWIYHRPSTGGDDPGTGFDDYVATPERIAPGVAELAVRSRN